MSAICGLVREGLDDYLAEALPAQQRRILREHLSVCAVCRNEATAKDASLVFARRIEDEVTPDETAEILAAVRTGVGQIETERRIAGAHPGRRRSAVAAAAAAVALVVLTAPGGLGGRREPRTALVPATAPVPTRVADSATAALEPAALPEDDGTLPSSATVYDLNPGASREEPRVVWIVDRGLDI